MRNRLSLVVALLVVVLVAVVFVFHTHAQADAPSFVFVKGLSGFQVEKTRANSNPSSAPSNERWALWAVNASGHTRIVVVEYEGPGAFDRVERFYGFLNNGLPLIEPAFLDTF